MKWAVQLGETICFLHSCGVIHRDLRCVNLLVGSLIQLLILYQLTESLDIKVSDFGVAFWTQFQGHVSIPLHYMGDKSMYTVSNTEVTIEPSFDLRYYNLFLEINLLQAIWNCIGQVIAVWFSTQL